MKAAFFMQHGGPEVLQYGDVPDPAAGAGELLVDVHAASVNAADWKMRPGSRTRAIAKVDFGVVRPCHERSIGERKLDGAFAYARNFARSSAC